MNRESSRSHTVLTLTIQSMALVDGINHIRESRFNLVDLAGSERQKQANTEGLRLKEAGNINKSLLCLGLVINALGEIAGGHSRHVVCYLDRVIACRFISKLNKEDSQKLTSLLFLLSITVIAD